MFEGLSLAHSSLTSLTSLTLQVQFAMFVGMRSLGWSVGSLEAISAARGAASGVYAIIDAVSKAENTNNLHGVLSLKYLGEQKINCFLTGLLCTEKEL